MKIALIITTYNWKEALKLALDSVKLQKQLPDEVIVADDGSKSDTEELIKSFQKNFPCKLIHSWQKDKGFRAAASRNKAIKKTSRDIDYIVFIDGDIILHPFFIKDHINFALKDAFAQGHRVLISKKKSKNILYNLNTHVNFHFYSKGLLNRKNALHIPLLAKAFSTPNKKINGIRSCNMAFWKNDLIKINGFNEEFIGWGREDTEIAIRLFNNNVYRRDIKFGAIAYHLHHKENPRGMLTKNDNLLEKTISGKSKICKLGLTKL